MDDQPLIAAVEAFLKRTGMAESAFGRATLNDWKLVSSLRGAKPRRLWPETEAKVRAFMASYQPANQAKAA